MGDTYIKHHGVLGMKWGVRRYQNSDGSLNSKGLKRAKKVESSKIRSYMDTIAAKSVYRNSMNTTGKLSDRYGKAAAKYQNKASKSLAKGNTNKSEKYRAKASSAEAKSKTNSTISKMASKKLSDIETGKIKAGRDFIVQTDIDVYPLVFATYVTTSRKVLDVK